MNTPIVYWGPLDQKEDLSSGIVFVRGEATLVPSSNDNPVARRLLRYAPNEFFPAGQACPEEMEKLYLAYPEIEIRNWTEHKTTYERVAWTATGKDEREKEARRKGALSEAEYAQKRIDEFTDMLVERRSRAEGARRGRPRKEEATA